MSDTFFGLFIRIDEYFLTQVGFGCPLYSLRTFVFIRNVESYMMMLGTITDHVRGSAKPNLQVYVYMSGVCVGCRFCLYTRISTFSLLSTFK